MGALRIGNGQWEHHACKDMLGAKCEIFVSTDKNPAMVKKELGLKQLRKAFQEVDGNLRLFSDKAKGELSANWKPLVRFTPKPGDEEPILEWCMPNMLALGLDKDLVLQRFHASGHVAAPPQWSL
eukprot:3968716-Pyramimonas_sp.AAC.1